ncbi:MAG: aminoglycoside phosphotransferase family protein [Alphaproteobacteria bacterium]
MSSQAEAFAKRWGVKLSDRVDETHASALYHGWRGLAPVVLKIGKPHAEEAHAAPIMQAYQTYGGVTVFEADGPAVLMPLLSGIELSELTANGEDEEATEIFCSVMQKLHRAAIPHGTQKIEALAKGFENSTLPPSLLAEAKSLFAELCKSQGRPVLLHGDLHHTNILQDINRGWVVIDPKGLVGEAEIDCWSYLRNPINQPQIVLSPETLERRINQIAAATKLHAGRIRAWAFTLGVLSACWDEAAGKAPDLAYPLMIKRLV